MERKLVAESGLDFARYDEVYAGPIHGVNPLRMLTSIIKLAVGTMQSFGKLLSIRPKVILLTGGWSNLPVAVVAWILRIPIVIYLPDIEPGLTIKVLATVRVKSSDYGRIIGSLFSIRQNCDYRVSATG